MVIYWSCMRSYVATTTMYLSCIFHSVMVLWILVPYGAFVCGKEALFAPEAVHCRLELILEMAYVMGSIICSYLLQPFIVGIMICLEVFMVCLMLCLYCWGY